MDVFSTGTTVPENQDTPVKFMFVCPHLACEVDHDSKSFKQLNRIFRDIYILLLLLFNLHVWLHFRSGSRQICEQGIALRKTSILGQAAPTAQSKQSHNRHFKNTEVKSSA